jgi:hypothetical protein
MNRPDFTAKNAPKIAEVKLSSCGLEFADSKKKCDCGIAELRLRANISIKVAELRLRKCFLLVAELRLPTPKKVARAHLCAFVDYYGLWGQEKFATETFSLPHASRSTVYVHSGMLNDGFQVCPWRHQRNDGVRLFCLVDLCTSRILGFRLRPSTGPRVCFRKPV